MITIVVGAQYGGEGKGKVCAFLEYTRRYDATCRCGGPNSSHTVVHKGKTIRLRMMPTAAAVNPRLTVAFGAGSLIHVPTLLDEIGTLNFEGEILVDPQAGIVSDELVQRQRLDNRYEKIGSTLTGTGYATAERSLRRLSLARDELALKGRVRIWDVAPYLQNMLRKEKKILVEGHQGFGLSNYHGDYPYVSSRDSIAAAMLGELGLGPRQRKLDIVLVVKLFPTRNHNGHLTDEIAPEEAEKLGIRELGGGSWGIADRRRRVGTLDMNLVLRAVIANTPVAIALTGVDYYDHSMQRCSSPDQISPEVSRLVSRLSKQLKTPVTIVSTGPETESTISLAGEKTRKQKDPGLGFQ